MATVPCRRCETLLKIPPTFTGKVARCPKCRGVVSIPQAEDDIEEAVEIVEEEPLPRRTRLREEEVAPARAKRRRVQEDVDEPEDDPAPRRKRPRKRPRAEGPSAAAVVGVGLFVFAFWLLLAALGYRFRPVSYGMLFVGAALSWAGTKWILSIAAEEGTGTYLACLLVPFFETWFTFTRLSRTWAPCLLCWAGRLFGGAAIILLILHFVRGVDREETDAPPGRIAPATAAEDDKQAEELLRGKDTAEARAWLGEANKRRGFFKWGRQAPLQFVNELYARGAVMVTVAEIDSDPILGEVAGHLVVALPAEPEKRRAVLALINERFADDDEPRKDHGQKYEVLTPD